VLAKRNKSVCAATATFRNAHQMSATSSMPARLAEGLEHIGPMARAVGVVICTGTVQLPSGQNTMVVGMTQAEPGPRSWRMPGRRSTMCYACRPIARSVATIARNGIGARRRSRRSGTANITSGPRCGVHEYSDGSLVIFEGPRCLAHYDPRRTLPADARRAA
jgi:hypothetical protein